MNKQTEKSASVATPFGRVRKLAEQETDMTPVEALQPVKVRLQSLANDPLWVLSASSLGILREVGLSEEEISSLVFANHNVIPDAESTTLLSAEDGARFRLIAGVLSHCLDVFGSDKKALYWLRQPVSRFELLSYRDEIRYVLPEK